MIRKFNYTGRRKIPAEAIKIQILKNADQKYFIVNADLQKFKFPSDSKIYVEAYFNLNTLRFDYGTIGEPHSPSNTSLEDLPTDDNILFRLKVVDESDSKGKILGKAERLK